MCRQKVPHLPIFDAIFTRIGQQMTWFQVNQLAMVEMMEANNAIRIKDSLDSPSMVGRERQHDRMTWPSPSSGYIHEHIGICKTLFATTHT